MKSESRLHYIAIIAYHHRKENRKKSKKLKEMKRNKTKLIKCCFPKYPRNDAI